MTAEPTPEAEQRSVPGWMIPPPDGFTAEEFLAMKGLPPHTELIDGSLVLVSAQRSFHSRAVDLLASALRRTVPADLLVRREMAVVLDARQCPEPDVCVIRAEAETSDVQTSYQAADVVLVIEVVSPESELRDRERKPQLYAKAGIVHFWRVERAVDGMPVVFLFELDPATGAYASAGVVHDRLKLNLPFVIDIDLSEIKRL
ncbi:Uma2 family endonuclease [Streptacidiphilus sp. N1-3]|uniref:Uma2 family endonuclease n=1 Tax=Streptacidiphilus alkalitolerans TaxID=3342712 RepID=A0ABV6X4B1_9ACTN